MVGETLLLLTAGIYAYWLLGLASFVLANHHLLLQDTPRLTSLVLAAAGMLTIAQAGAAIVRKVSIRTVPAGLPTLGLCLLIIWTAFTAWQAWMPGCPPSATGLYQPAVSAQPNDTTFAFTTPLPNGKYSPAAPASNRRPWFPTDPIEKDVASVLGASAAPVTLSDSEHLFAFVKWPGLHRRRPGARRASTPTGPPDTPPCSKLSHVTDPAAFTAASARTAFGPVDVFILQRTSPTRWVWQPFDNPGPAIAFTPAQFSPHAFTVFTNLPGNYVLAVRQPQRNS